MTCLVGTDIFKSLDIHATLVGIPEISTFGTTLAEARKLLRDRRGDTFEANAWWQELITRARRIGDHWSLVVVWMAIPRLRQMAWKVHYKTGLELHECHCELLLSALDMVMRIDLKSDDIGDAFIRMTAAPVWELLRSTSSVTAYAFEDLDLFPSQEEENLIPEVAFGFTEDAIKNPPTTKRLEGERFGALARKLDIRSAIRKAEERIFDENPMDFVELFDIPEMIDLATAAKALGISTTTAYKRVKNRSFPCAVLRRGGNYLIPTMSLAVAIGISPPPIDPLDFLRGARFSAGKV